MARIQLKENSATGRLELIPGFPAEGKAYLSSHKPNLATLGDVMPKLESE
jgi:hypothetical protein